LHRKKWHKAMYFCDFSVLYTYCPFKFRKTNMIKTAFAAAAAAVAFAAPGAALAGPYVNVEANSGFSGTDYVGTTTDAHVGYSGTAGVIDWYAQIGASYVSPDGGDADTVPSGKAGASIAATESVSVYGEVSFLGSGDDDIDRGYGTKVGATWSF